MLIFFAILLELWEAILSVLPWVGLACALLLTGALVLSLIDRTGN